MARMRGDFVSQSTERAAKRKSSGLPTGQQLETTNLNFPEKWVHGNPMCTKTFLADVSIPLVHVGSWTIFCIPGFWKLDPTNLEHNRGEAVGEGHDTNWANQGESTYGGAELPRKGNRLFFQDIGQRDRGNQCCKRGCVVCVSTAASCWGGGQEGAGKGQSSTTRQAQTINLQCACKPVVISYGSHLHPQWPPHQSNLPVDECLLSFGALSPTEQGSGDNHWDILSCLEAWG